jgi:4-carboxymuconolactone decarboxylase
MSTKKKIKLSQQLRTRLAVKTKTNKKASGLPETFKKFTARFPDLTHAHEKMGKSISLAGPLSRREQTLVKIGLCVGAGMESALRSHVRRALQSKISVREIEHAVAQAMTTLGFPRTVQAWSWAHVQIERSKNETI